MAKDPQDLDNRVGVDRRADFVSGADVSPDEKPRPDPADIPRLLAWFRGEQGTRRRPGGEHPLDTLSRVFSLYDKDEGGRPEEIRAFLKKEVCEALQWLSSHAARDYAAEAQSVLNDFETHASRRGFPLSRLPHCLPGVEEGPERPEEAAAPPAVAKPVEEEETPDVARHQQQQDEASAAEALKQATLPESPVEKVVDRRKAVALLRRAVEMVEKDPTLAPDVLPWAGRLVEAVRNSGLVYDTQQVAVEKDMSVNTVLVRAKSGQIGTKVGDSYLYTSAEVADIVKSPRGRRRT